MPREERLSNRLNALLEAVFESPSDPFSLYWDIAAHMSRDQLAPAQKMMRRKLRQKGEVTPESGVLVACVMALTGFPPQRILHFLSLYVPGGIRLSLFDLAVGAIFLGEPPIPTSLQYDLTQYTYLEKRLLVRKSLEISERLKESLSPRTLLYMYLLSQRDDLSNENVQLIALVMKNCFPTQELRGRIGEVSLEEYGEIARAWKLAERRSLEQEAAAAAERRAGRAFDRNSASFFLDKYFSDEALAAARESAPTPPKRPVARASTPGHSAPSVVSPDLPRQSLEIDRSDARETRSPIAPARRNVAAKAAREPEAPAPVRAKPAQELEPEPEPDAAPLGHRAPRRAAARRQPVGRSPAAARSAPASRGVSTARTTEARARAPSASAEQTGHGASHARGSATRRFILYAPVVLAACLIAVLLGTLPGVYRPVVPTPLVTEIPAPPSAPTPMPSAPPATVAAPAEPAPPVPSRTTYVVKPGDSLWKIFTSMRADPSDRRGWMDFVTRAQSLNRLGDPDRLQPGKVLTLSPPQ